MSSTTDNPEFFSAEDDFESDDSETHELAGGHFSFVVDHDGNGDRLDRYVSTVGPWSRAFVQQLIDERRVTIAGVPAKGSKRVVSGMNIAVDVPEPKPLAVEPEPIPLEIVYEDDDLVVVNKPRGMVVHPAPGHQTGTLVGALLHHLTRLSSIGGVLRPGIVHRIDKDTSGLLVVAKSDLAHHSLVEQLREHSVTRVYEALVHGVISHDDGTIDAPIGRDPHKRQQMAVTVEGLGRRAVTHFHVLERFLDYSSVRVTLETGRTHQIRVHMAYIGHPVAGDPVYARRDPLGLSGQALHAKVLGFTHPRTGERLLFEAEPPAIFEEVIEEVRRQSG